MSKSLQRSPITEKKMYKKQKSGLYRARRTINGKTKYFAAKTKIDLMLKITEYERSPEAKGLLPLNKLADEWLEDAEKRLTYNTLKGYRAAYKKIIADWKDTIVQDITSQDVLNWLKKYEGLAQKTITNLLLVLRLIIDYGCLHYRLQFNPCDKVKAPKGTGKKKRDFPSPEDIQKVNESIDLPFGLFMYTILYTGMRRGEAAALRWGDIDWDNKRILISRSSYWDHHIRYDKPPKSEAGVREVPLLDSLAKILKKKKGRKDELVFGEFKEYELTRGIERYIKETGITCTPHGLRHGFASILFKQGLDIKTIQYVLGHAQSATTMEIYVHLLEKDKTALALQALQDYQAQ